MEMGVFIICKYVFLYNLGMLYCITLIFVASNKILCSQSMCLACVATAYTEYESETMQ